MSLGGSNFASLKVGLEWQAERRFQASAGGVKRVTTVCHAEASSAVSSAAHTSGRLAVSETDLLSTLGEEVHLSLLVRNPEIGAWLQKIKTSEFPQDIFRSAPEHIRDNQEIALAVVSRHGFSLKFASHNLRDDRQVVLAAVQQTGAALAYASERLKAEKDMVLLAVKRHGAMLEHASQDLQSDREVVLAAVSNQARALRFAAEVTQSRSVGCFYTFLKQTLQIPTSHGPPRRCGSGCRGCPERCGLPGLRHLCQGVMQPWGHGACSEAKSFCSAVCRRRAAIGSGLAFAGN
eukprot:s909_g23.t2